MIEMLEDPQEAMVADMLERAIVRGVEAEAVLVFGREMAYSKDVAVAVRCVLEDFDL